MRKMRRGDPLHPDETVGKVDAGKRKTGGSDALHRAG